MAVLGNSSHFSGQWSLAIESPYISCLPIDTPTTIYDLDQRMNHPVPIDMSVTCQHYNNSLFLSLSITPWLSLFSSLTHTHTHMHTHTGNTRRQGREGWSNTRRLHHLYQQYRGAGVKASGCQATGHQFQLHSAVAVVSTLPTTTCVCRTWYYNDGE